jgi:deoxyribonuclease-4
MKLWLGSHVDLVAPSYLLAAVETTLAQGGNTMMIYTGAPQNSIRKPVEGMKIQEAHALMQANHMDLNKIIVHAPYIINLGNTIKSDTFEIGVTFLIRELQRVAQMGFSTLVLHPGAHVGEGKDKAIAKIIQGLNQVLAADGTDVTIALETMAGKGTEVGDRFEDLRAIIDGCAFANRLGVCLDTCHIHDAGYDVKNIDEILATFDQVIGLAKLKVIHINDSKNPQGARKDRHENIGYGHLGYPTLVQYLHHPRLDGIPKILETPWIDEIRPYQQEIAMLKNQTYIEGWREQLKSK